MLDAILSDFRKAIAELKSALAKDDIDKVIAVDRKVARIWDDIIKYDVADANDAYLLAEFLLSQMATDTDPKSQESQIRKRILELVKWLQERDGNNPKALSNNGW